ncbi:MAG: type III secretion system chaperone [Proteobacteria bacterium]|nr:type III secretion system chaperone [Pseudomonadota bacterium]
MSPPDTLGTRAGQRLITLCEMHNAVHELRVVGEDHWVMALDDGSHVQAQLSNSTAGGPSVVLQAELGRPHERRRLEMAEALLSFNLLWADTGGMRAAMAGSDGQALLLLDLSLDAGAEDWAAALGALLEHTAQWRGALPQPPDADGADNSTLGMPPLGQMA